MNLFFFTFILRSAFIVIWSDCIVVECKTRSPRPLFFETPYCKQTIQQSYTSLNNINKLPISSHIFSQPQTEWKDNTNIV